jgi:4-oxalmesaconate hydratase
VRGLDPETGHYFDDTRRYLDAGAISATEKANIFEHNIRRVFPRLDRRLRGRAGGPAPTSA